jgi:hypothetical protein
LLFLVHLLLTLAVVAVVEITANLRLLTVLVAQAVAVLVIFQEQEMLAEQILAAAAVVVHQLVAQAVQELLSLDT